LNYEELLIEADKNGLITKEKNLKANDGRIKGNLIAIKKNMSELKKACVLAEELGHYYTSTGNIMDLIDTKNRKQEYRARIWAYDKQIGLQGIVKSFNARCISINDMAEYLNVTEDFLIEALECYRHKYGMATKLDNYVIGFEPTLYVMELFEGI